MFIIVML